MARRRRRPHGFGSVYRRDGKWFARFPREADGRRPTAGPFPDRDLAERVLARGLADLAAGRAGIAPDPASFPTLAALGDAWIERRKATHRAWLDDQGRWRNHLRPALGHLRAAEVDAARLRAFVEAKRAEGLNPATVGHCVRLLSSLFSDLVERSRETGAASNPVRTLPRATRRLFRPTHDPMRTPFLESLDDVARLYRALRDGDAEREVPPREQTAVAFAVGALAMLRTGEVLGLDWTHVDLDARRIVAREQVQDGRLGPLKDDEARVVPIQRALLPILAEWKLRTGGEGLLFRPSLPGRPCGRDRRPATFVRPHTLHAHLADALGTCHLPSLTWYQATRHTGASHWVMQGGSVEKLAAVLGHSSAEVTRRYAHLRPDLFPERDYGLLDVDLRRGRGEVVAMADPGSVGHRLVTTDAAGGEAVSKSLEVAGS